MGQIYKYTSFNWKSDLCKKIVFNKQKLYSKQMQSTQRIHTYAPKNRLNVFLHLIFDWHFQLILSIFAHSAKCTWEHKDSVFPKHLKTHENTLSTKKAQLFFN